MRSSIYEMFPVKDMESTGVAEIKCMLHESNIEFFDPIFDGMITEKGESPEEDVKEYFESSHDKKSVFYYILEAYSKQSKSLILGSEFIKEKEAIADKVGVVDKLKRKCTKLESVLVSSVVLDYLNYQGDRDFKRLQMKKDLYEILVDKSTMETRGSDGSTDIKTIMESSKYSDQILQDILVLEQTMRTDNFYILSAGEEVGSMHKGNANISLRIENNPMIAKRGN